MSRRRRIFFFNRFYRPDSSATAQILRGLCEALAVDGPGEITVVTSRLNYADPGCRYPADEVLDGVRVRRLWSTRFGRGSVPGRLLDYLSIYASFFCFMLRELGPEDMAVFKTDPPLLSVPGAIGKQFKGYRMVAWCQDLFPEVAMAEMRLPRGTGWFLSLLRVIRDWSLRNSDRVVVLGRDMERCLVTAGIPEKGICRIANWSVQADDPDADGQTLRAEWGIPAEAFVVGYSGNLGRAHDWRTILGAARILKEAGEDTLFLCCGGGYGYERLREAAESDPAGSTFRFMPYQPLERLAAVLRVPDLHWVTLKERLTPYIVPSKFFGILQAGRPVLFIGDPGSEIAGLIRGGGIGAVAREGDASGLAAAIRSFRNGNLSSRDSGERARRLWLERFQKAHEVAKWDRLLRELANYKAQSKP